jgi:hypothetical protein
VDIVDPGKNLGCALADLEDLVDGEDGENASLAWAKDQSLKQARAAASTVFLHGATPVWVTAVLTFLSGVILWV